MGSYKEIKGDLISLTKERKFDAIAHGCNCFKTMGAGIAFQIAKAFPIAYQMDTVDRRSPIQRLGDYTCTLYNTKTFIFNLYTQYNPGPNLEYSALELSLIKMDYYLRGSYDCAKIGLPLIGCGIAGGDWEKVRKIIQRVLSEHDVTVVIYDK